MKNPCQILQSILTVEAKSQILGLILLNSFGKSDFSPPFIPIKPLCNFWPAESQDGTRRWCTVTKWRCADEVAEPGQQQQMMSQVACPVFVWEWCTMLVCAQGHWRWELHNMSVTACSQFFQIYNIVLIYSYWQWQYHHWKADPLVMTSIVNEATYPLAWGRTRS